MRLTFIKCFAVVLGLSLPAAAGLVLETGAARAETNQSAGVELLSRAQKSYEAGAYSDAAAQIESAFKAGLTGEMAARAILLRAEVNEKSGALAMAFQDYSNAVWMETLPPAEMKKATAGKERVKVALGLESSGTPGAAQAAAPQSGESQNGVFGFISGVFGGSGSQPAQQPAEAVANAQPPAAVPAQPVPATARQAAASQAAAKPVKVAHAKSAPPAHASAQPTSALSVSEPGEILIVFGSASSEASGHATAKSIKAKLADIFVHRDLDVAAKPGGSFQIQAGPYPKKSSALALCSAIKERGIQCHVTQ